MLRTPISCMYLAVALILLMLAGTADVKGDARDADVAGAGASFDPRTLADCNSNGTEDADDIAAGTAADVNSNGVPDSCEISDKRTNASKKGSLLIYPRVEIRYDAAGKVVRDTFITLTNDYNLSPDVTVQLFFVSGDPHPVTGQGEPRLEWPFADATLRLTPDQPAYWSVREGRTMTASGLGFDVTGAAVPDPRGSGDFLARGFILAFAVDVSGLSIRWNHLFGEATIVDYRKGTAWTYAAYAFAAIDRVGHGQPTGTPGVLNLDGIEYDRPFNQLVFNFFGDAIQEVLSDRKTLAGVTVNTDLVLMPVSADFAVTDGVPGQPVATLARFVIHNANENKKTNTRRCVTCWEQVFLAEFDAPNWFLQQNLGTDEGKAGVDGVGDLTCDLDFDPDDAKAIGDDWRDIISQSAALLGVTARHLSFGAAGDAVAGYTLNGRGAEPAVIRVPIPDGGPTDEAPGG